MRGEGIFLELNDAPKARAYLRADLRDLRADLRLGCDLTAHPCMLQADTHLPPRL